MTDQKLFPLPKIQLVASIVLNQDGKGRNALMIRKIFVNTEIIRNVVLEIIKKGAFDFSGEIVFMDKSKAIARLKEAKLL